MTFLRASNQANAKQTMRHPQQGAQRLPPSRNKSQVLTTIVLTLTFPKLHLESKHEKII